jgi:hypothetical protein
MTILLELIIVGLLLLLIIESLVVYWTIKNAKKERNELIKMIIAKNLPEYEAISKADKPPPEHKSMILKQQTKMINPSRKEA